jgi:hypothetical protein
MGKATEQSSTILGGDPRRAVDGILSGVWTEGSVTHTERQPGAWWMVDLGADHVIQNIIVHNRTDCCPERLNAQVFVTDTKGWPNATVKFQASLSGAARSDISVPSAAGRYVYIVLNGTDYLSLAEVEVVGTRR